MKETSTPSTTTSYSTSYTSSINRTPHEAVIQQNTPTIPQPQPTPKSSINWEAWAIPMVGMALTGLVGYFTSMMALKDEISKNRESAAILKSELDSLKSDLEKAESEIKNGNSALRKAELLEVKLDNLNSRITEHTNNSRKN